MSLAYLEENELLSSRAENLMRLHLEDIKADGFGDRSALTNGDDISFLDSSESRGTVGWDIGVTLLKPIVLLDEVQVVSAHNDGSVHFGGNDHTSENTSSDPNVAGEGTVVVYVVPVNCVFGSLEAQTYVLPVAHSLASLLSLQFL